MELDDIWEHSQPQRHNTAEVGNTSRWIYENLNSVDDVQRDVLMSFEHSLQPSIILQYIAMCNYNGDDRLMRFI